MGKRGKKPKQPKVKSSFSSAEKIGATNKIVSDKVSDFPKENKVLPKSSLSGIKAVLTKIKKGWLIFWLILGGLITVSTGIRNWPDVKAFFSSPKQNFDKKQFSEGNLNGTLVDDSIPWNVETPMIFNSNPINSGYPKINGIYIPKFNDPSFLKKGKVSIKIGSRIILCPAKVLLYPQNLLNFAYKQCAIGPLLTFGVKDSRMYVAAEFKDLQNEQTIGIIEYNHWKLCNKNLLTFSDSDSTLEVRDNQNYVAFSIKYFTHGDWPPDRAGVEICGYLMDPTSILIMGSQLEVFDTINGGNYTSAEKGCISKSLPNWKKLAEIEINKIRSIH